jgi:hypothetical protein
MVEERVFISKDNYKPYNYFSTSAYNYFLVWLGGSNPTMLWLEEFKINIGLS